MILTELIGRSLAAVVYDVHTLTSKLRRVIYDTAPVLVTHCAHLFILPGDNTIMIDLERYLTQHHASHAWSRAQNDHWHDDAAVFGPSP